MCVQNCLSYISDISYFFYILFIFYIFLIFLTFYKSYIFLYFIYFMYFRYFIYSIYVICFIYYMYFFNFLHFSYLTFYICLCRKKTYRLHLRIAVSPSRSGASLCLQKNIACLKIIFILGQISYELTWTRSNKIRANKIH